MSKPSLDPSCTRPALGGVLAAGSLIFLWLACLAPSGRFGLTAVAGLFPVAGVLVGGQAAGYLCWAAAGLLGLFLLPDKGVALLYLAFLGIYPVVKGKIESMRCRGAEWLLKLAFFNGAMSAAWFMLRDLLLPNPPLWLAENTLIIYLAGNAVFAAYDIGLSKLIAMLRSRLQTGRRWGAR